MAATTATVSVAHVSRHQADTNKTVALPVASVSPLTTTTRHGEVLLPGNAWHTSHQESVTLRIIMEVVMEAAPTVA